MDAMWTALEKAHPCRMKTIEKQKKEDFSKKVIDWLTA